MDLRTHRPQRGFGRSERSLAKIAEELTRFLTKAQRSLTYDTLHLPSRKRETLASLLVECAEDLSHQTPPTHPLPLCELKPTVHSASSCWVFSLPVSDNHPLLCYIDASTTQHERRGACGTHGGVRATTSGLCRSHAMAL